MHEINSDALETPDIVISSNRPIVFHIGNKNLYVRPMTDISMIKFRRMLIHLLTRYRANLSGFQFLLWQDVEAKDKIDAEIIQEAVLTFSDKKLYKELNRLINQTILKDKYCNPEKISRRYMMKHSGIEEKLQIFYLIYAYHYGGGIKKKGTVSSGKTGQLDQYGHGILLALEGWFQSGSLKGYAEATIPEKYLYSQRYAEIVKSRSRKK